MVDNYRASLDWVASQQAHMVFLTESWSAINSGSYNVAGVQAQAKALADNFSWLGGVTSSHQLPAYQELNEVGDLVARPVADALSIRKRPDAPLQILLVGHMDTVFAVDDAFQKPRYVSETILNGPGVADLKGGLVVMLKALEALEKHTQAERIGWQVILNPDEEIGSISSGPLLQQSAVGKHLGLVYEPALADGTLAGARKGSGNFSIKVTGRAAHAGRNPEDGRNAVVAAAVIAQQLFALNGVRPGLSVNPANIRGGGALNVVPDLAIIRFNIRTQLPDDEAFIMAEIEAIIDQLRKRDGFEAELHGRFTRPPKPMSDANKRLFEFVQNCGRELGQQIAVKPSGGCCDGNNLWHYGLANVDTLGVRGEHIHSPNERVYLESLTEKAQLSALLLMKLASGEFSL